MPALAQTSAGPGAYVALNKFLRIGITICSEVPSQRKACSAVGENDLILLEILKNFSAYDLKKFRLINRKWNALVTSLLLRRNMLHIQIDNFPGQKIFFVDNGQERFHRAFSLRQLAACMNNSSRFPCGSFTFKGMPSLQLNDSLQGFVNSYGTTFKTLRLMCITSFQDLKFILKKTPNLENLTIVYLNIQNCRIEKPSLSTKLKSIQVHFVKQSSTNNQVFKYILQSSPLLKKIQDFQIEHLSLVKEVDKLHLIQTLKFAPDLETLKLYKTFASLRINLTELNISMITVNTDETDTNFVSQVGMSLSAILNVSANSLKKLKMLPLSGWDVQFPVLPNLEHICFTENDEYIREYSPGMRVISEQVFPSGFDFPTHFPRIASICFAGIGDRDIGNFFPEVKANPIQAQDLEILTRVTPGEICFLTTKLSRMTTLELRHTFLDTSQVNLWSLIPNTVSKLRLYDSTFFSPFPVKGNKLGLLDYYFTRIFSNQLEGSGTQARIFQLKNTEEPSFSDLQNLRSLDFTFELLESYLNLTWFTPLTGRYAFAAIEKLRVTFYYDMNSANATYLQETLKPMSDFVTFSHYKCHLSNNDY
ncbi:unnamed protein product [Allacma fusca]|uniref:F-box domain-containing protein n=1 Tax=Allacma fusca TaxID=39272 RepID=A0A8J2PNL4_9HEXA|nr:unnamed protein product [Allacma fusca]